MPVIVDDIDDLFTEEQLNIDPGSPTAPRGLWERVDELHHSGCRRKIAWSNIGSIAYITPDTRSIRVSTLRYDVQLGKWGHGTHTDGMLLDHIAKVFKGRELVHIEWNPNGWELLIADVFGRILMCSPFIAINRLAAAQALNDAEDSLNAVVGVFWLNAKRPIPLYPTATKQASQWKYGPPIQQQARGPYNPFNQSAFILITRGGVAKLAYKGPDGKYRETKEEVDGIRSSSDLLTHAALCTEAEGDDLLLVTHDSSKLIKVYRLSIDWHQGEKAAVAERLPPSMNLVHVTYLDICAPLLKGIGIQDTVSILQDQAPSADLCRLELLPPILGTDTNNAAPPAVVAIFLHNPDTYDAIGVQPQPYSIIARWELRATKVVLDESFEQLTLKRPIRNDIKEETTLQRLEDLRVDRALVDMQQHRLGTVLSMAYSDGGVELRDRTLAMLPPDEGADRVSSLNQIGFDFNDGEPCLHVGLSPHSTVKAYMSKGIELRVTALQAAVPLMEAADSNFVEKAVVGFVREYMIAESTFQGGITNTDDIMMCLDAFMKQLPIEQRSNWSRAFLTHLGDGLRVGERLIEQNTDKYLSYAPLHHLLSIQFELGDKGPSGRVLSKSVVGAISSPTVQGERTVASKFAWLLLNLRYHAILSAHAFKTNPPKNEVDAYKPDIMTNMATIGAWTMTLLDWIVDQTCELHRQYNGSYNGSLSQQLAPSVTLALLLLLSSPSRGLLRYVCRSLRAVQTQLEKWMLQPQPDHHVLFHAAFVSAVVPIRDFEDLLHEAETLVRAFHASLSESDRQALELRILIGGAIPPELHGVVDDLLSQAVDRLRQNVDEAELAFKDYSVLCITADSKTKKWERETLWDGMRKLELGKAALSTAERAARGLRIRRCARCATVMEDLLPTRGMPKERDWMGGMQRSCLCGGHWVTEP